MSTSCGRFEVFDVGWVASDSAMQGRPKRGAIAAPRSSLASALTAVRYPGVVLRRVAPPVNWLTINQFMVLKCFVVSVLVASGTTSPCGDSTQTPQVPLTGPDARF